ncbi:hypothetical protein EC968_007411 [Mortierella alpina]|nr:hypothetical protein EC968_007411 [Mortierella alpina]
MDDLVLHVQTEVALDGASGKCPSFECCSWERFWYIVDKFMHRTALDGVEQREQAESSTIKRTDQSFRQFFWNNFIQEEGVVFYEHDHVRTAQASIKGPAEIQTDNTKASFVPSSELKPLESTEPIYKDVMEKHKDSIRIVACAERQRQALLGNSAMSLPTGNQAFQVLQSITAARELGATQAQLAKQHEIDPRSMFHFLKVLIDMKLIVKIPVTTGGQYTLLCLHAKFASSNPGYIAMNSDDNFSGAGRPLVTGDGGRRFEGLFKSDTKKVSYYSGLIKQKLTDILGRSKTKVMTIDDLAKALDLSDMNTVQNRWFNRQIELLCKLKYIKRVSVTGQYRCVQLLRPYGTSMQEDEKEKDQLNLKSVIADDTPQSGICIDSSIEHQVYKLIVDSKEQGMIAKEIRNSLNKLNLRLLARILDTLCKPVPGADKALVNRVVEFVGRERRYRYYSESSFTAGVAEDHKEYIAKARVSSAAALASRSAPTPLAPTLNDSQSSEALPADANHDNSVSSSSVPPAASTASAASTARTPGQVSASELSGTFSSAPLLQTATTATATAESTSGTSSVVIPTSVATPERYISVALLKRRRILQSIVDRKKVVEIHATLVTEYQKEKKILFPDEDESSIIDRKTLYRTLNIMEAEGLVKIVQVHNLPTAGRGTSTKTFCLHPTMEPDSKEMKAFVKECSDRQSLFGSVSQKPMKAVEKVEVEVETFDQMQQRLGDRFYKGPAIPFSDVGALKPKQRDEGRKKHNRGYDFDGSEIATQFGWYKAKMMRALVFHRFLLDRLTSEDKRLYPWEGYKNVIATSPLFEFLALRVFLIVVGILQEPSTESKEFLEAHRDSNMPLSALPDHMKPLVVPNMNFKKRLREALEILDALGLVTPLANAPRLQDDRDGLEYARNHLVLNTYYEVHLTVKAPLDRAVPEDVNHDLSNRKQYNLAFATECRDFWMDLQATASRMKVMETDQTKSAARPWGDIRRDFLLSLCNKRIWADPIRIKESQKAILMKYVNETIQFAPTVKDTRLDEIAAEAGMPKNHVVGFYNALRTAWYTKSTESRANSQRKQVARLSQVKAQRARPPAQIGKLRHLIGPASSTADAARTVNSSTIADAATTVEATKTTLTTTTATTLSWEKGRYSTTTGPPEQSLSSEQDDAAMDDEGAQDKFVIGAPKRTRARRVLWTPAEDDRMLMALALIRHISLTRNTRFSWYGVARALHGNRKPEICRHRVEKLMRETLLCKRLESYKVQFSHAFADISEKFSIEHNLQHFDPNPILEYFQPSFETPVGPSTQSTPLPHNPAKIGQMYIVRHTDPMGCLYVEDKLNLELSMPKRMAVLKQLPSTIRGCSALELDYSPDDLSAPHALDAAETSMTSMTTRDEKHDQEHVILAIIKAIYSMPYRRFTRELSRVILGNFAPHTIQIACHLAKEWKVLRLIRKTSYRIPGQNLARSERFSNVMSGAFPRAMTAAAAELDADYKMSSERDFKSEAGPAEMLVLFNSVALGWVQLCMKVPVEGNQGMAFEEAYGQGALVRFDVHLKMCVKPTLEVGSVPGPRPTIGSNRLKRSGEQLHEHEQDDPETVEDVVVKRPKGDTGHLPSQIDPWQETRAKVAMDFEAYLNTIPAADRRRLYQAVYEVVSSSCSSGMVLQDIKSALHDRCADAPSDKDIMECIGTLQQSIPPVILKVGMAHPRYVMLGWHERWTVNYAAATRQVRSVDQEDNGPEFDPMNWIVPRMWRTLDGKLSKPVFEKSLHAVLTHIVEKPGCSKGALLRHFYKVLLPAELDDLLEELESRKAVLPEYVIQPKTVSLFSKREVFVACDRDTIDERKITNYFPQPAYYSFLDMDLAMGTSDGHSMAKAGEESAGGDEDDEWEEDEEEVSTPYDPHPGPSSKTAQLQQQVNDVVGIMQQNIDSVRDRGEKLDSLQHKTTDLEQGAVQFRKGASGVRRQMWWKNMKWRLIVGVGIILLLVIIIVPIVKSTK